MAVHSGQTIVLGGLITNQTSSTQTGIPLLMDLPWLGALFSSTNINSQRKELVVMITPKLVESAATAQQISNEYKSRLGNLYGPKSSTDSSVIMEPGTDFNSPNSSPR